MRIALLSRTVILMTWLTALLWLGDRDLPTVLLAVSLVAVWTAAWLRDARRARPTPAVRPAMAVQGASPPGRRAAPKSAM